VLVSEDGTVQALWLTYLGERNSHSGKDKEYHLGLATPIILPVLQQIQKGIQPKLRILNVEMHTIQMSQARIMGVEEEWIERVEREDLAISYLWCRRSTQATMTACKRATSF
jgi:pro-apoptotic serine protease NMA111